MLHESLTDAARLVHERSRRELAFTPEWHLLEPRPEERPAVAAVDGSHAVLVDNGAVWVVATRAASTRWPGPPKIEVPTHVAAAGPEDAQTLVEARYARHGMTPPTVRSAEAFAEALRALAEHEATLQAMADLPDGGLVLIDGALEHLPPAAAESVERLLAAVERRHVTLIGVAKRSRLASDGVPLVPALRSLGAEQHPDQTWAVPVPQHVLAHVALLHPRAKHAFRVDTTDAAALADLLPLARDAVYVGYPYPLAVAHNNVAISQAAARRLRDRLGDEVRRCGGGAAWNLLEDFHETLDRNAPRL